MNANNNIGQAGILSAFANYGVGHLQIRSESRAGGRTVYARCLWAAFPRARSEEHLAEMAAPILGLTKRQVQNHLAGVSDGKVVYLVRLAPLVGAQALAGLLMGEE